MGDAVLRQEHATPHDPHEARLKPERLGAAVPVTRRLTVFTQDPATRRMDVSVAQAHIPYEPLEAGPGGCVVRVIDSDATTHQTYEPLDLDGLGTLAPFGVKPSTTDPRFAQQMTYAVAMATYDRFRQALGRVPDFAFPAVRKGEPPDQDGETFKLKLHVYPHAMREDNAYYEPNRGALLFGYTFANKSAAMLNQPGGIVFTSLSHDVVVHEMTHALLDGMRAQFMLPSNPDVDAFHEAFADLVALFQRFQYVDLVSRAMGQADDLSSGLLTDIARQWGQTTGDGRSPLRSALVAAGDLDEPVKEEFWYDPQKEAHDLGAVLVAAVFDAFRWVYKQKTERVRKLAAGHSGARTEYIGLLTSHAQRLATQFLNILIRAIDYCPPVDVTFGEFLRALITADFDIVPEDPWGYREALILAFRRYRIVVSDVRDLSEDALLWRPPGQGLPLIGDLAFKELRQGSEPDRIPVQSELERRARALGAYVTEPGRLHLFGLIPARHAANNRVDKPVVESIRTLRRIGPDNSVNFDLVAEVIQRRKTDRGRWFYGGSTVIVGADGGIRYSVVKHVDSVRRRKIFTEYLATADSDRRQLFQQDRPNPALLLRGLHARGRRQ